MSHPSPALLGNSVVPQPQQPPESGADYALIPAAGGGQGWVLVRRAVCGATEMLHSFASWAEAKRALDRIAPAAQG